MHVSTSAWGIQEAMFVFTQTMKGEARACAQASNQDFYQYDAPSSRFGIYLSKYHRGSHHPTFFFLKFSYDLFGRASCAQRKGLCKAIGSNFISAWIHWCNHNRWPYGRRCKQEGGHLREWVTGVWPQGLCLVPGPLFSGCFPFTLLSGCHEGSEQLSSTKDRNLRNHKPK